MLNGTTYVSSNRKLTLKNGNQLVEQAEWAVGVLMESRIVATPPVPTASGSGSATAAANGTSKSASAIATAVPAHHQRTAAGHRLHKATPVFTGKLHRPPRPSRNKVLNNVIGTTTTNSGRWVLCDLRASVTDTTCLVKGGPEGPPSQAMQVLHHDRYDAGNTERTEALRGRRPR